MLLLWIIHVISVSFCYAFMHVCLLMPCGHLLGKGWLLCSRLWCLIVTLWRCHFPIGILGQVWCLILSIPDRCPLSYFKWHQHDVRFCSRTGVFKTHAEFMPLRVNIGTTILNIWSVSSRYFEQQNWPDAIEEIEHGFLIHNHLLSPIWTVKILA